MTKIDKILKIVLIMVLSAYQMKHIAHVEGWQAAIIIETAIIIMSILRAYIPLALVLLISSGFVLSYHFDSGFVLSIKAVTEILMSFSIPFISAFIAGKKEDEDFGTTIPELALSQSKVKTKNPKKKAKIGWSDGTIEWLMKLKSEGMALRDMELKTGYSKSKLGRFFQEVA